MAMRKTGRGRGKKPRAKFTKLTPKQKIKQRGAGIVFKCRKESARATTIEGSKKIYKKCLRREWGKVF